MNLECRLLQGCSGVILVADAGSPAHQEEMGFGGEGFAKSRQKLVFSVPNPFLPDQLGEEGREKRGYQGGVTVPDLADLGSFACIDQLAPCH